MALPSSIPERQLRHRRSIGMQAFARCNGLCEGGVRPAPIAVSSRRMACPLWHRIPDLAAELGSQR